MKVNCESDQGQNVEYIRMYANINVTTEIWNHFYGHFFEFDGPWSAFTFVLNSMNIHSLIFD